MNELPAAVVDKLAEASTPYLLQVALLVIFPLMCAGLCVGLGWLLYELMRKHDEIVTRIMTEHSAANNASTELTKMVYDLLKKLPVNDTKAKRTG